MTKKEYMQALKEELEKIRFSEKAELLEDYENHFQAGIADGKSEEMIVEELGDIDELIAELRYYSLDNKESKKEEPVKKEQGIFGGISAAMENAFTTGDKEKAHKAPKHIDLELICADAVFRMSDGNNMKMEYKNDSKIWSKGKLIFTGHQDGDTFYAKEESCNRMGIAASCESKLIIGIPTECESIRVRGKSGDIVLQNIVGLEKFTAKTMSGDVHVHGGTVKELHCESMSGDVEVRNHAAEHLSCKSMSGDLNLEGTTYFRGEMESVSGDVHVDEIAKDSKVQLKSVSGDVQVVVRDACQGEVKTTSGDVRITIEKECTGFVLETKGMNSGKPFAGHGCGNVRIRSDVEIPYVNGAFCYGDRSAKLYAGTVSGDVLVKHYCD